MTTLVKRRNPNRLLSQWNERLFPWSTNSLRSLMNFDDVFNGDFFEESSLLPAMNIKEQKDYFSIELAAPGFNKKDFEVIIEDNVLHVSGDKSTKKEEEEEGYARKEFSYKSFKRSLALPESIDLDQKVKAIYKDGILNLKLLKKEEVIKATSKKVIEIA